MLDQQYLDFINEHFLFYPSCYVLRDKTKLDILKLFNHLKNADVYYRHDFSRKNQSEIKLNSIRINDVNIDFIFEYFKYENKPSFIRKTDSNFLGKFTEDKYGYVLIVKIGKFIFIQKTGGTKLLSSKIKKSLNIVGLNQEYRNKLLSLYDKLSKLKISNVNSSTKEYENMELEAENLLEILPEGDIGNFFPRVMKAGSSKHKKTITINAATSGLMFSNQDIDTKLSELIDFYHGISNLLEGETIDNKIIKYQENFTKKLDTFPSGDAKYIKFLISNIEEQITLDDDNYENPEEMLYLLESLNGYFELSKEPLNIYKVNSSFGEFEISLNPDAGKEKIKLEYKGTEQIYKNIFSVIRKNNLFKIYFEGDISYFEGEFYKIKSYEIRNIDPILDCLKSSIPGKINSEKGLYSEYSDGDNAQWSSNCIFFHIEETFSKDIEVKYLFCGDMGNEMADHIAFTEDEIVFIHGKANGNSSSTNSVSIFSELISQAIKNIGHLKLDKDATIEEIKKLSTGSLSPSITKGLSRSLTGHNIRTVTKNTLIKGKQSDFNDFLEKFKEGQVTFNKKIILAIDFFDRQYIVDRLNIYKNSPSSLNFLDIQFIDSIGHLISICKKEGIKFEIWCKEN